jgi:hypothetical protein
MSLLFRLSQALLNHFWAVWGLGLVGILLLSFGMFQRRRPEDRWQLAAEGRATESAQPNAFVAACFGVFLCLYIGFMLWGEDFAFQDGHSFTDYVAIGIPRPPSIWPDSGRFWPLGYGEYNLIAHLSPTATAFLAYAAIQLLVGLWFLYRVMPSPSPTLRLATLVVLLWAPAFAADFAELTYADRNVDFALCVLIFLVDRYDRSPALSSLLPAMVVTYAALYHKETTIALLGSFAGARVLLRASRQGWRSALRSPLEIGMLACCACFVSQLAITLLPAGRSSYVNELSVGRLTAASRYLTADPLLTAFLLAFGVHLFSTLRRGGKLDPLWDTLAVGGALHIAAVSMTGLEESYLMGPTEMIAMLTLLRLVPRWWRERPQLRPILAGVGGAVVAATMVFGTFRLIQRKNVVRQTQRIASFLVSHYGEPAHEKGRLYFVSEDGMVMNFVSFLGYKGLRFHRRDEPQGVAAIDVAGPNAFPDDRCVHYKDYVCRHDAIRPGDIVVRLAEDTWSTVTPPSGTTLEPLFQVNPVDFFPSLRPLLAGLYRVSPTMLGVFGNRPLPEEWLRVSATKVVAAPAPSKH